MPAIPNRSMNPKETTAPTRSALPERARGDRLSKSSSSVPRYRERYAGNMAKPHGFTAAIMSAPKANPKGSASPKAPNHCANSD